MRCGKRHYMIGVLMLLGLVCLPAAASAAAARRALPTTDELHQLYDQGKHALLLRKLSQVLTLEGDAAAGYHRYELLMLQGDALLQARRVVPALDSFSAAVEEAADAHEAAIAKATVLLVQRSRGLKYTPQLPDPDSDAPPSLPARNGAEDAGDEDEPTAESIGIVDRKSRKEAFAALYDDEMAALGRGLDEAMEARSMPRGEVVSSLADLCALEIAATDKDEQTRQILTRLADHAHKALAQALERVPRQLDEMLARADQVVRVDPPADGNDADGADRADEKGQHNDQDQDRDKDKSRDRKRNDRRDRHDKPASQVQRRRGLSLDDAAELQRVVAVCKEVGPQVRQLLAALGTSDDPRFDELVRRADRLAKRAQTMLETDYNSAAYNVSRRAMQ